MLISQKLANFPTICYVFLCTTKTKFPSKHQHFPRRSFPNSSVFPPCSVNQPLWIKELDQDQMKCWNMYTLAPRSPNYVRKLTDSLKAPYPTTLACLIPSSLSSWWLLRCPHLWCGYWISLLLASAFFFFSAYILYYFCVCLYDAIWPLGCDVMLIKSYHIKLICIRGKQHTH